MAVEVRDWTSHPFLQWLRREGRLIADRAAALAVVNETRAAADAAPIRCGIALHVGDVHYGNVGGEGRLDFTVIGPAVNSASRVEQLCGQLGEDLLLSADFVAESRIASTPLGSFALKGIAAEQTVYVPD